MLRSIALMLAVGACGSCMEMRETVERTVVVRTTGSDLQPAATGFIYQKKNDGEESVIEMGESEVMEHLAKYYDKPTTYEAPAPKRSRYVKDDSSKEETSKDGRVIPVKENEDGVDGIADDDYRKIFDEYMTNYGHSGAYKDYLKGLEHFKGKFHYNDGNDEQNGKEYNGYEYGQGGEKKYGNQEIKTYAVSGKGGHNKGHDSYTKYYDNTRDHEGSEHGQSNDNKANSKEFSNVYDSDDINKKKYNYGKGYYKFADGHKYHGPGRGYGHGAFESGNVNLKNANLKNDGHHDQGSDEKQAASHSAEKEDSSHESDTTDSGSKHERTEGKGYGFEIKH